MTLYQEISAPLLDARTRVRYSREVVALEKLGFRYLASCLESQAPFSAILQLPILLLTLAKKEVLAFPWPLRLALANALLGRNDPSTIALCMGMGVKLYTSFGDGTLLISSTFQSFAVPRPGSTIIKPAPTLTIEDAWSTHTATVKNLETARGAVRDVRNFAGYVMLSRQEEDPFQYR